MMWQDLTEEQKLTAIIEVTKQRDDLKQQLADYRNTIAQQAELLAAHKAEMQDWQRELLTTKQQLAEAQRVTFDPQVLERMNELEQQRDELLVALEPFSRLLQEHNSVGKDDRPIFGINSVTITLGDLRRAVAAIAKVKP